MEQTTPAEEATGMTTYRLWLGKSTTMSPVCRARHKFREMSEP